MTIGPGASENEVSAAAASTGVAIVSLPDRHGAVVIRHTTSGRLDGVLEALLALVVPAGLRRLPARRRRGARRSALSLLPAGAAVARRAALRALWAAGAVRRALPGTGAGVLGRVGAGRLRGRRPGAGQRAQGARRGRPGAADGRADRRHRAAGAGGPRPTPVAARPRARRPAAPAPSRRRPRGAAGRRARAALRPAGRAGARPARGHRRPPGRPLARAASGARQVGGRPADRPARAVRGPGCRDPRRRRPHHRRHPARLRLGVAGSRCRDVRAVTYARALRDRR